MTKYTDEQINEAIMLANQTGKVYVWETEMYRNVIEHLPEPQDDLSTSTHQQIKTLRGMTGDDYETTRWLYALNTAISSGISRHAFMDSIDVMSKVFSTGKVTTAMLNQLADRGIATPSIEPADEWETCTWGDILHTDKRVKAEYISGTVIEGVPDGISDNGVYLVDNNIIPYSTDAKFYRIPAPVQPPDPAEHPVIIVHLHNGVKETKRAFVWNGESYGCLDGPHSFLFPYQITKWSPAKVVEDDR